MSEKEHKLLPCPFCGGDAEMDTRQGYRNIATGRMENRIAVYCRECNADMGVCLADVPDITPEQVADMWNARLLPAASEAEGVTFAGLLSTFDKPCEYLGIDLDQARKAPGKPLEVFIAAIDAKMRAAGGAEPVAPPAWWSAFITNVCEIPDRNSPDDEPDAIVATREELEDCALRAIEDAAAPGNSRIAGDGEAGAVSDSLRTLLADARHRIANLSRALVPFDDPLDGPVLRRLDAMLNAAPPEKQTSHSEGDAGEALECERCEMPPDFHTHKHWCDNQSYRAAPTTQQSLQVAQGDERAAFEAAYRKRFNVPDDAELARRWVNAGGDFHGPRVETGTMPRDKLLPFLRSLVTPLAQPEKQTSHALDGWKLVPIEPTEEMWMAWIKEYKGPNTDKSKRWDDCWAAILDAAPAAPQSLQVTQGDERAAFEAAYRKRFNVPDHAALDFPGVPRAWEWWQLARQQGGGDAEDAARYRLLRKGQHWSVIDGQGDTLRADQLDAAIDAARAQRAGREGA